MKRLVAVAVCLLAVSAAPRAETIKVSSGVAADLQNALTDAAAGDTVSVSGGPYLGNFTIPAGKDGLTLKGKVILEAQGDTTGILVESSGVTLASLTIRHAQNDGVAGPSAGALAGLTISKCTFIDCGNAAVSVLADDAIITGCVVTACESGVAVTGERVIVEKSRFSNLDDAAMVVDGDDPSVSGNVIANCGVGIDVHGENAVVTDNRVTDAGDGPAIRVQQAGATVTGNQVDGSGGFGIFVTSNDSETSGNEVNFAQNVGILVSGESVSVLDNRVDHGGHAAGISIVCENNSLIEGNRVTQTGSDGFSLNAENSQIRDNRAQFCGGGGEAGFLLTGSLNLLVDNVALDCASSGFRIEGDSNSVANNVAMRNADDGFHVLGLSSDDNNFDGNKAKKNGGEGLHNGGAGTELIDNSFTKNQLDLANETMAGASLVDLGGNVFKTGGLTTEPTVLD